ncbi:MAG: bifunctional aspartate kinase/homoserine dehydrogenase I [Bacteroidota bacterium]
MKILKFGGSSVSNAERIREVTRIILESAKKEPSIIVVSAFQGITNQLLECAALAEAGNPTYGKLYAKIVKRHESMVSSLFKNHRNRTLDSEINQLLGELHDVLHGINLLRHAPERSLDLTASFGERLSTLILSAFINIKRTSVPVDARDMIITDDQFTHAAVQFDKTNVVIRRYFNRLFSHRKRLPIPVVTGFIASTEDGRTTTLGRNGSDYTAAIIGAAMHASVVEIWTDVDGVMSADPRAVPSAFVIPRLSYEEAMEMSFFGAKVLHSATIAPAVAEKIPILIKNTLNPSAPGTLISESTETWEGSAKGMSSVDQVSLLTIRGLGMVGVHGTAERLFRALATAGVNIILISQASSEHTICFAVSSADTDRACEAIRNEFHYEVQNNLTVIDVRKDQTIIAVVGENMQGTPGVSGRVFSAVGRNAINVNAIAQGGSELNISFVIDGSQRVRALNVVHEAFFEKRKKLALIIIGVGNIGSTLLKQLHQQRKFLIENGFDVRVCGISNSKQYVLSNEGIDPGEWRKALDTSPYRFNPDEFINQITKMELTNAALVDCTASSEIVDRYPDFVRANMHIVTPNKKANVLPWKRYQELMDVLRKRQKFFFYEANVGAGLPVISTLQDLMASGDTVIKIEGIFSGTLSYIFNCYDGNRPFSALLREAHTLGYTEPDPRDDLSGQDVARKILILARQLGLQMDLDDIYIQNLVPPRLRSGKFSMGFFKSLRDTDAAFERLLSEARSHGSILRYVGWLSNGAARAEIKEYPSNHPFASTKDTDNIIAFTTQRYAKTPLVIQGPGAGADVTAMGVFSDIRKLLYYLPF